VRIGIYASGAHPALVQLFVDESPLRSRFSQQGVRDEHGCTGSESHVRALAAERAHDQCGRLEPRHAVVVHRCH